MQGNVLVDSPFNSGVPTCGGQPAGWLGALAPRVSLPLLLPLLLLLLLLHLSLLTVGSVWLAAAALFLGTLSPVVFEAFIIVLAASIRLAFSLKIFKISLLLACALWTLIPFILGHILCDPLSWALGSTYPMLQPL